MKRIVLVAALFVSSAALSVALAASDRSAVDTQSAQTGQRPGAFWGGHEGHGRRHAEGFFDHFRSGNRENGRHHRHRWDDDDDDDDRESASADRGGADRPARNGEAAPTPDSGIFNGKAQPKAEVR